MRAGLTKIVVRGTALATSALAADLSDHSAGFEVRPPSVSCAKVPASRLHLDMTAVDVRAINLRVWL